MHVQSKNSKAAVLSQVVYHGAIADPDNYIWDSWQRRWGKDGLNIDLYALSTPKAATKNIDIQTERDHIPHHWRLFRSTDGGNTWSAGVEVFGPRLGEDVFDSRSIWTGSVKEFGGKLLAAYTGIRQTDNKHPYLQGLGLAVSEDGGLTFRRLTDEALSDPRRDYDLIRSKGYYLGPRDDLGSVEGEEGRCAMAWRDPELWVDGQTVHMFWSAKAAGPGNQQIAVLGHGIVHDPLGSPKLELLAPVHLPDSAEFTQAEVPQFVYDPCSGKYYAMISTSDRVRETQHDEELTQNVRLYRGDSFTGPWVFYAKILEKADKRYPGTLFGLFKNAAGETVLRFTAPYNRANPEHIMHTLPKYTDLKLLPNGVEKI